VGHAEFASFLMQSSVVDPTAAADETSVPDDVVVEVVVYKNLKYRRAPPVVGSYNYPLTENCTLVARMSTFIV
jgi:hypothetical protein